MGIHFYSDILAFAFEKEKNAKIEYIAIFEADISIGDVFACPPFNALFQNLICSVYPAVSRIHPYLTGNLHFDRAVCRKLKIKRLPVTWSNHLYGDEDNEGLIPQLQL